jgi:hypothetical protein
MMGIAGEIGIEIATYIRIGMTMTILQANRGTLELLDSENGY